MLTVPLCLPASARAAWLTGLVALWCGAEVLNHARQRGQRGALTADGGSYGAVVAAFYVGVAAALLARAEGWAPVPPGVSALGPALMLAGIGLREWAVLALGDAWSLRVQARPGQSLVFRGPYRHLRHPAYTGSILTLAGFGLAIGTLAGASAAALIALMAFQYRARIEERFLLLVFGDDYLAYLRRTWRFFPRW